MRSNARIPAPYSSGEGWNDQLAGDCEMDRRTPGVTFDINFPMLPHCNILRRFPTLLKNAYLPFHTRTLRAGEGLNLNPSKVHVRTLLSSQSENRCCVHMIRCFLLYAGQSHSTKALFICFLNFLKLIFTLTCMAGLLCKKFKRVKGSGPGTTRWAPLKNHQKHVCGF